MLPISIHFSGTKRGSHKKYPDYLTSRKESLQFLEMLPMAGARHLAFPSPSVTANPRALTPSMVDIPVTKERPNHINACICYYTSFTYIHNEIPPLIFVLKVNIFHYYEILVNA